MLEGGGEGREGEILLYTVHQKGEEIFLGDLVLVSESSKLLKIMKQILQIINVSILHFTAICADMCYLSC